MSRGSLRNIPRKMEQAHNVKNTIKRIKEVLQNLILETDHLSSWDRQMSLNAITEIRCEIMNLEQDLESLCI